MCKHYCICTIDESKSVIQQVLLNKKTLLIKIKVIIVQVGTAIKIVLTKQSLFDILMHKIPTDFKSMKLISCKYFNNTKNLPSMPTSAMLQKSILWSIKWSNFNLWDI